MKELQHIQDMVVIEREMPMNPEALKEIRDILEGVKSGQLLHKQKEYHTITPCGTAHCIAGWKTHNDAIKAGLHLDYEYDEEDRTSFSQQLDEFLEQRNGSVWSHAQQAWGLRWIESDILFDSDSTLDQQFEMLELLEAGYTVK